jgi:phosphoribosyl 1,2-cyclic phosphodiesterase
MRYGGNTLCVEVRCGSHLLILDAGSGARALGAALAASGEPVDADILLSHTHLDHIIGLPFFRPLFSRRATIRFWGGHLTPPDGIQQALRRSWAAPLMPDLDQVFRARTEFHDFTPGETLRPGGGPRVATMALNHPGNVTGFRIEWNGHSVCYATDTEHPREGLDQDLVRFARGADILIYDATYTREEYATRVGWGHSTWDVGADVADAASVGRLVLFHHDPDHDDAMMDDIARAAADRRPGTLVSREGMILEPGQ